VNKLLLSVLMFFVMSFIFISDISAQTEIFGFGGYMMTSSIPVVQGDLRVDDEFNYGLGLDIKIEKGIYAELLWISEVTHIDITRFPSGIKQDLFDVNVHYFQVGAVHELGRGKARPFGAFTIGTTLFHAQDPTRSDEWLFSATLGGGAKIDVSDKVGIRLQGRILLPLIFSGTSLWVGTGGSGVAFGAWTPFVQFDLTAGIYIKLGGKK